MINRKEKFKPCSTSYSPASQSICNPPCMMPLFKPSNHLNRGQHPTSFSILIRHDTTPSSPPNSIRHSGTNTPIPRNANFQDILIQLIFLLDLINQTLRWLRIKHGLDIAMHRELAPIEPARLWSLESAVRTGLSFLPEVAPLVGANYE